MTLFISLSFFLRTFYKLSATYATNHYSLVFLEQRLCELGSSWSRRSCSSEMARRALLRCQIPGIQRLLHVPGTHTWTVDVQYEIKMQLMCEGHNLCKSQSLSLKCWIKNSVVGRSKNLLNSLSVRIIVTLVTLSRSAVCVFVCVGSDEGGEI